MAHIVLLIVVLGTVMALLRLAPLLLIKHVSCVNTHIKFMLNLFAPAVISVIIFSEVFHGRYAHLDSVFVNPYFYGVIVLLLLFRFIKNIVVVLVLGNIIFFMLASYLIS